MANYSIARGTTWKITITVTVNGEPVNLTGHRLVCTVRTTIVDGTSDTAIPPLWQGDNESLMGIVLLAQSGDTLGQATITMPGSATQVLPNVATALHYDVLDNDGAGDDWQTEEGQIRITPRVGLSQP